MQLQAGTGTGSGSGTVAEVRRHGWWRPVNRLTIKA
jgi:hypothetical protein